MAAFSTPSATTSRPRSWASADQRGDDQAIAWLGRQVGDEVAVDLDPVDVEHAQRLVRRVADAEVVDRDPHALLAQAADRVRAALDVGDDRPLGDLELEPVRPGSPTSRARSTPRRRSPRSCRLRADTLTASFTSLGAGRDHADRRRAQHELGDRPDQVGLLGDADELARRDRAVLAGAAIGSAPRPCRPSRPPSAVGAGSGCATDDR